VYGVVRSGLDALIQVFPLGSVFFAMGFFPLFICPFHFFGRFLLAFLYGVHDLAFLCWAHGYLPKIPHPFRSFLLPPFASMGGEPLPSANTYFVNPTSRSGR
jgi:hypothetical protein